MSLEVGRETNLIALNERRALIILGMRRSGASAVTRMLGKLGAASDMNAHGFFESNKVTNFKEFLLASVGMTGFDPRRFPLAGQFTVSLRSCLRPKTVRSVQWAPTVS